MADLQKLGVLTTPVTVIDGQTVSSPADPKATGVTVRVRLPVGRTTLKAWFSDAGEKDLCGAFFVTVTRQD